MLCGNISLAPSSWEFSTAQVNLHVRIMVILCHMEALNKTLTTLAAQRNRFVGMACAETMPVQYTNCLHTWWRNVVQYVFVSRRVQRFICWSSSVETQDASHQWVQQYA